jgi:aspartate aminotransferase-like enzyme
VGTEEFIKRHMMIAKALRDSGKALGLVSFAENPSSTVTAFKLPENINGEKVQKIMQDKYNITIAGGQEQLKGKIIRIGHMGAIEKSHMLETIEKLSMTLNELGLKTDPTQALNIIKEELKHLKPLPYPET